MLRAWSVARTPVKFGGHIGDYKVDISPFQGVFDPFQHRFFPEIALDDRHPRHRRDLEQIHGDHASGIPDALGEHLRPAPGRSAEIDNTIARTREAVALHDLEELVGRARAVPPLGRLAHVGIAHVALQPRAAGFAPGHCLDFSNDRIIA
jgi:hypothetical protein